MAVTKSNYDKQPFIEIEQHKDECLCGYEPIIARLCKDLEIILQEKDKAVLAIDCYPGVYCDELVEELITPIMDRMVKLGNQSAHKVNPYIFTDEQIFQSAEAITQRVKDRLSNDRVFGQMCLENYEDLISEHKFKTMQSQLETSTGLTIIYGAAASSLIKPDVHVYADMARWEIQLRFRKNKIHNWMDAAEEEDNLKKFKWGYFFAWRVADRYKKRILNQIDYILDTNIEHNPKLLSGEAFREGLETAARKPFRVVPFFDPGVWGGQWMKEACDLDRSLANYAWCFDCVPEENSLLLKCGSHIVEIPSLDLIMYKPVDLLGPRVFARFGAEFPIRFDFLDTFGGQNLSLQVHPLIGYAQEKFGMHYTQEESYYLLDAKEESKPVVYLGVQNGVTKEQFLDGLEQAQAGKAPFDAEHMVNAIPVKKHDHILIPPGTIHCSGADTMVLEISSTPYIFTFKLWDWGRLGLDGKPRPIHLAHGREVIDFNRNTDWVKKNLVNNIETLSENKEHISERTGLHELEFIDSVREWFDETITCKTKGSVNVANLIEGEEIEIISPIGAFAPMRIHYAETFIIPENVGTYIIRGIASGEVSKEAKKPYGVIIARVRV